MPVMIIMLSCLLPALAYAKDLAEELIDRRPGWRRSAMAAAFLACAFAGLFVFLIAHGATPYTQYLEGRP